jgi:hypothetical protein
MRARRWWCSCGHYVLLGSGVSVSVKADLWRPAGFRRSHGLRRGLLVGAAGAHRCHSALWLSAFSSLAPSTCCPSALRRAGPEALRLADDDGSQTNFAILRDRGAPCSVAPEAPTDVSEDRRRPRLDLCRRRRFSEGSQQHETPSASPCRVCGRGDGLRRPLPQRGGGRVDCDRRRWRHSRQEEDWKIRARKRRGRCQDRHFHAVSAATRPRALCLAGCLGAETAFAVLYRSGALVASIAIGRDSLFRGKKTIGRYGPGRR